jgi:FSR family fosmidomycin resistance protein-like MFS transporter
MTLLRDALFSAVAMSHFAVDFLNGQRAVILTFLSVPLGLTNTVLGFFSTLYVVTGALFQPVFGYFADRIGARWVVTGGLIWLSTFFTLALITPGRSALWLLVLASLGSAAFHPAGTMQATLRGRTHFSGRETTSAALFFFFGQSGSFMGPVVAGPLLDHFGLLGLLWLGGAVLIVGLNAGRQLGQGERFIPPTREVTQKTRSINGRIKKTLTLPFIAFALVAAFQAWSQQNIITFMPKYLHDLGVSASIYGLFSAFFVGGSAFGGTLGGGLADRLGRRWVIVGTLTLASIPLYLISVVGWSAWLYLLTPLAGAFTGGAHSILVVQAQRMLPGNMGLASGLILGFMFSAGALGTLLCGYLADLWGFPPVFMLTSAIALFAGLMAITLKNN